MKRAPPRSTRTATLFPSPTLFRAPGELLHAREQGAAVDDHRQGLDQGDVVVAFHRTGEAHDGVAGHQAVGVEDQALRVRAAPAPHPRSEEHTSELQSLMRISYAVFCLNKKNNITHTSTPKFT